MGWKMFSNTSNPFWHFFCPNCYFGSWPGYCVYYKVFQPPFDNPILLFIYFANFFDGKVLGAHDDKKKVESVLLSGIGTKKLRHITNRVISNRRLEMNLSNILSIYLIAQ